MGASLTSLAIAAGESVPATVAGAGEGVDAGGTGDGVAFGDGDGVGVEGATEAGVGRVRYSLARSCVSLTSVVKKSVLKESGNREQPTRAMSTMST